MTRLRATLARRRVAPVAFTVALSANPGVTVKYESAGEGLPARLAAAVERGTPPDVAVVGEPRLLKELADGDALSSLDYMKDYVKDNLGESAVALGSVDGTLYGVLFKEFNDSTVWFNPFVFRDAGLSPPRTWRELTASAAALADYGTPAFSIGAADGEALAGLFDNIYLRQAGPEQYDRPAARPRDPLDRRVGRDRAADDGAARREPVERRPPAFAGTAFT